MTSISYTKGNNQRFCSHEPETKQKEEGFRHSMKNLGYREEEPPNKSDGNTLARVA